MYTTLTLLFTFLTPATPGSPHWRTDYYTALNQVTEQGKPLAVFVGWGKEGWNQICSDGDLGKEAKHLLAENYVCVYVDSKRPDGKRLAEDFDISDGLGLAQLQRWVRGPSRSRMAICWGWQRHKEPKWQLWMNAFLAR